MLIEVKNLSKIYQDDGAATPALDDISFNIKEGEFVAITGPSGSGKSTLLHVLGFLDRHTSGQYLFEGKNSADYSETELAQIRNQKMGFVFQSFNLLPRTSVLENVKLPLLYSNIPQKKWDNLAKKAIAAVDLSHRLEHESSQLSGGEKQRVAIARALIMDPKIIFADEPTGNLDSKSGRIIMEILQKLNQEQGRTILLITHETYTAENAERIIHIVDGQIESDRAVQHRHQAGEEFQK